MTQPPFSLSASAGGSIPAPKAKSQHSSPAALSGACDGFIVIKREGTEVSFDAERIRLAITKCFLDREVFGPSMAESDVLHTLVVQLSNSVIEAMATDKRWAISARVAVEDVQDQVELALMREGQHAAARSYVHYRDAQAEKRLKEKAESLDLGDAWRVRITEPTHHTFTEGDLHQLISSVSHGLAHVDQELLIDECQRHMPGGSASMAKLLEVFAHAAQQLMNQNLVPEYDRVSARIQRMSLDIEVRTALGDIDRTLSLSELFVKYVDVAISDGVMTKDVKVYDLQRLAAALDPSRDDDLNASGVYTLRDRYVLKRAGVGARIEVLSFFFMRVAMGVALREDEPTDMALRFYHMLSTRRFMSSSPTLFNAATRRPQLSSCFLTTVPDDLSGIFQSVHDNAMLSKWAGGLGNDWTPVRSNGALIKGSNGTSNGTIPYIKVANDGAVAVNQSGKRAGALAVYLETWHGDIEAFLQLRMNTGDERIRAHDTHPVNWIPDLFMRRVKNKGRWVLFSPSDCPDLHDLYGKAFNDRYEQYERDFDAGKMPGQLRDATHLWREMLNKLVTTGHPWMTFKDPCNIRSPQRHVGVVHSSNLCTEITLNTSDDEIAVCNLGSVNLAAHLNEAGGLDIHALSDTIRTAVRMLDNVLDVNFYPLKNAENANQTHRPIGLGLMGFQDVLYANRIAYDSQKAVDLADDCMEKFSYLAIEASADLAEERGAYPSFKGSLWDQGIFPLDSIELLRAEREAGELDVNDDAALNWTPVREKVQQHGMRNSNVMAIAPTATIANICDVSSSIEPLFSNVQSRGSKSGFFPWVNKHLVDDLRELGMFDEVMSTDLKQAKGSVAHIRRIPNHLKALYKTAFEIDNKWLIESAARRQKWIDQAQSLNLHVATTNGKQISALYELAWLRGLKTTYYLRTQAASQIESTAQAPSMTPRAPQTPQPTQAASTAPVCLIEDPDCEACQ